MISDIIVDLYKRQRMTLEDLAEKIGMSRNGFHKSLQNNDFKVSTLEKIATALNVKVSYFFNETEKSGQMERDAEMENLKNEVNELRERIKELKEQLKDKSEIIDLLKKGIAKD